MQIVKVISNEEAILGFHFIRYGAGVLANEGEWEHFERLSAYMVDTRNFSVA